MSGGLWDDGKGDGSPPRPRPPAADAPPGWSAAQGAPPASNPLPVIDVYVDGAGPPAFWDVANAPGRALRVDGVEVVLGADPKAAPLWAEPGWLVALPLEPNGVARGQSELVFLRVANLLVALRVVDTCFPPPGYIRIPEGWLVDVDRMRATRLATVRPLRFEDWQVGMRASNGLELLSLDAQGGGTFAAFGPPRLARLASVADSMRADRYICVLGREAPVFTGPEAHRLTPDLTHSATVDALHAAGLIRTVDVGPYEAHTRGERA